MSSENLDEYSASWQLESDYPEFRGILSLLVSTVCLSLLIALIRKLLTTGKSNGDDTDRRPDVCRYCSICCRSDYFECANLFVLPAPLDVAFCIYFFGFLCFLCNGCGILIYGSWLQAANYLYGSIAIYVFASTMAFCSICVYLYFYCMLMSTISAAGSEFQLKTCTQRFHKLLMLLAGICLPSGNILMDVFGQDFGRIFRLGQVLAYGAFGCAFLGISHLAFALVVRLEMVLVNSMSADLVSSVHRKSRSQIRAEVHSLTEKNCDAQLLHVITKLTVVTLTILMLCIVSGLITAVRYYYADHAKLSEILSLARWAWFTLINIAFGAFCLYLTMGFNSSLYTAWCRCSDRLMHQCVLCCVKRSTIRKVTMRQSETHSNLNTFNSSLSSASNTRGSNAMPNNTTLSLSPSSDTGLQKTGTYSSMQSASENEVEMQLHVQTPIEEETEQQLQEERVHETKSKIRNLANAVDVSLKHEPVEMGDRQKSDTVQGYTPNEFNHMHSEQL